MPGAILKGGQDTTRARKSPEKKCEGFLHGSLSRVGKITVPIHPDNPHLTTFTQHVMVGITRSKVIFFWMLHGSTKVVVRVVALLSAKTKKKVAISLKTLQKKIFRESKSLKTTNKQTPTILQSPGECRAGVACSSDV